MSKSNERIYKRTHGLAWQVIDERVLILEPKAKTAHEINEIGSAIWRRLDGEKTVGQIAGILAQEFEISEAEAEMDALGFCADLEEKRLVECL